MTRGEAITRLREMLPPGSTVCTIVRHVSRSGGSRSVSCIVQTADGIEEIDALICRALELPFDRHHGGVKVQGSYDPIYFLAWTLSGDGETGPYKLHHKRL